jgi:RNA polymerase sigma factor (sigma-70 family)
MLTDSVLVDRVVAGFDDAFDELYRRHVDSAWRVAQAVTGNAHDAGDAVSEAFAKVLQAVRDGRLDESGSFRAYLLTATRNASLDILRRTGKLRTGADEELDMVAASQPGPAEKITGREDAVLMAEAFRALPERWRSVLWLTEVEGVATREAAAALGLTANGAAQLAVRARAGLRDRFLQAHIKSEVPAGCQFTVSHLGAYVGGGIAPRDLAKVDQHLAGCQTCLARKEELEDVGTSLRRIAFPIPLALAGLTASRVHAALASASSPASRWSVAELTKSPTPAMRRMVGASAAIVLGLGVLALPFTGDGKSLTPKFGQHTPVQSAQALPDSVVLPTAVLADTSTFAAPAATALPVPEVARGELGVDQPTAAETAPSAQPQPQPPSGNEPAPAPAPAEAPADPLGGTGMGVVAGANTGDHGVAVVVDATPAPAAGVTVDDQALGTTPAAAPEEPGVVVQLGPVGPVALSLP